MFNLLLDLELQNQCRIRFLWRMMKSSTINYLWLTSRICLLEVSLKTIWTRNMSFLCQQSALMAWMRSRRPWTTSDLLRQVMAASSRWTFWNAVLSHFSNLSSVLFSSLPLTMTYWRSSSMVCKTCKSSSHSLSKPSKRARNLSWRIRGWVVKRQQSMRSDLWASSSRILIWCKVKRPVHCRV